MCLSGCATTLTSCPPPTPIDAKTQTQAAEELASLPANSAIAKVLIAALNDRDKLRACRMIK